MKILNLLNGKKTVIGAVLLLGSSFLARIGVSQESIPGLVEEATNAAGMIAAGIGIFHKIFKSYVAKK